MFSEQEVFAKIGFLVMALDKSQAQVQQLNEALIQVTKQNEETSEATEES